MIRIKRWNDPCEAADGFRLLVCRYRPRGLRKKEETWKLWWKHLGPSAELHRAIYGKDETPISWEEFRQRYVEEMQGEEERNSILILAEEALAGKTITLLCSTACTDPARCHRSLLKELVEQQMAALAEVSASSGGPEIGATVLP